MAVPTAWTAAKQTMMIRASITAYSTAVGPSSLARKRRTFPVKDFMAISSIPIGRKTRSGRNKKQVWDCPGDSPIDGDRRGLRSPLQSHTLKGASSFLRWSVKVFLSVVWLPMDGVHRPSTLRPSLATGLPFRGRRGYRPKLACEPRRLDKFATSDCGEKDSLPGASQLIASFGGRLRFTHLTLGHRPRLAK